MSTLSLTCAAAGALLGLSWAVTPTPLRVTSKRELLTKKERDACLDKAAMLIAQAMKPVLPADKQVGIKAMVGIGALLRDTQGCTVSMLPIPAPLEVVEAHHGGDVCVAWQDTNLREKYGVKFFHARRNPYSG